MSIIVVSLLTVLFSCNTQNEADQEIKLDKAATLHQGAFAFCGASAAVPTGKKITVQGVEYNEGCAICPVLTGPSLSNLLMEGVSGTYGKFNVGKPSNSRRNRQNSMVFLLVLRFSNFSTSIRSSN